MQASPKSLSSLLASARRFRIPLYQRPYCWTLEEVEQLWDDLRGAHAEAEGGRSESYFLGPVVVATGADTTGAAIANVIDGQQRLTTFAALLWCAHHRLRGFATEAALDKVTELERLILAANKKETLLAVAREDQPNFQALRDDALVDETKDLGKTVRFFRDRLRDLDATKLIAFLNFIENRSEFVLVETETFSRAWDLFIGLNGKGRPLTPADLIKAFVCGTSEDGEAVADVWKETVLPLGRDATSALLDICRLATGDLGSESKLFKTFEAAWKDRLLTHPLLSAGARAYGRYWQTPDSKEISPEGVDRVS